MSVYVGIDVHRKRSQVAVVDQDGLLATTPHRQAKVSGSGPHAP
jgi:hypothetical protein